jgi:hypothetical protein
MQDKFHLQGSGQEEKRQKQPSRHRLLHRVQFARLHEGLQEAAIAGHNDQQVRPISIRLRLKCDGTCAETIFRLSAKRTSPFKSAGASVQSTTGSRGVHISGGNAGYTMFRSSVKGAGYPLHSPVSPSLLHPCVTVCHHVSTGLYPFLRYPDHSFVVNISDVT